MKPFLSGVPYETEGNEARKSVGCFVYFLNRAVLPA